MANLLALITGTTSGIGLETARLFAANGYDLILTGRRAERLEHEAESLVKAHGIRVKTLDFDIRDVQAVTSKLEGLEPNWQKVDVLINNAGLARGLAPIDQGDVADWEEMIDTNIKGLLYVTRIVARWMRAAGKGYIVNVGSIAGKEAYPMGNVYVATKHAVDGLTKAMRMDLYSTGIKVSAVHPGMVETEFSNVRFHGDAARANQVYDGFVPLKPQDVADTILWMVSAPSHVNVADVVLLPADQASAMLVNRKPK